MDTDRNVLRRLKRLENLEAGGGGGGAGIAPLPRLRFIAGDTTQTAQNGSIAEPYRSIGKWITGLGAAPGSANDANQPVVGYLVPAIGGYTEDTAYPAGRNLLLTTDPDALLVGTVTGNATWANITVANPPTVAILEERNVNRIGNFTVTDDGTAANSIVIISCTNFSGGSGVSGTFDSHLATHFIQLLLFNAIMNTINCGTAATSGQIECVGSQLNSGTVSGLTFLGIRSQINCSAITVNEDAFFEQCVFGAAVTLTTGTGAGNSNTFDGPSWRNFLGAGGTRAAGVIVLVTGGYAAGPVYGAELPVGGGATSVSLNGAAVGTTAGFTGSNSGNVYVQAAGQGADATVTVLTGGGESVGDTVCITRTDLAAHLLTVKNNAGTTIATLPSGGRGSIVMVKAGATAIGGITNDWALASSGSVAA